MFDRLRYAARVLSTPEKNPYHEPDIAFEQEDIPKVNRISKVIGSLIEVLVITFIFGVFGSALILRFLPLTKTASVTTWAAVLVGALVYFYDHLIGHIQRAIGAQLKIGETIAPYFGHRITRALKTIRG